MKREKETSNSNLGGMPDTPALFEKQSPATYRKRIENFLPLQTVIKQRSDRKKKIGRTVV